MGIYIVQNVKGIGKMDSHSASEPSSHTQEQTIGQASQAAQPFVADFDGGPGSPGPRVGQRPRPPKLYRIGEVVEYSGMSRQTIHNYTTMGLLRESRWTSGGHRLYDDSVFERLDKIAEMKANNKSIQDIRDYFARLDG